MNFFEQMIYHLSQWQMPTPTLYGWYHCLWLGLIVGLVGLVIYFREKFSPTAVKIILAVWGSVLLLGEGLKLLLCSFHYYQGQVKWSFSWSHFPFQFCSTPLYLALPAAFLPSGKLQDAVRSYLGYFALLAGILTMFVPADVFSPFIFLNLHTMLWHGSMVLIGVLLLVTGSVPIRGKNFLRAGYLFVGLAGMAVILNFALGQTHPVNLFYLSPYRQPSLPIASTIYLNVPYVVYLFGYLLLFTGAAYLVFLAALGSQTLHRRWALKKQTA